VSGSNGTAAVADPRGIAFGKEPFGHVCRVTSWEEPVGTITASPSPSSGAAVVADPRASELLSPVAPGQARREVFGKYDIRSWDEPARTVAGGGTNGGFGVADPRPFDGGRMGVVAWDQPAKTVCGESYPSNGSASVADPRVALDHEPRRGSYEVTPWTEPAKTVRGVAKHQNGGAAVADPRVAEVLPSVPLKCAPRAGAYGVMSWEEAAATITGSAAVDNGRVAVADPRRPPPKLVVIIAADGTWHRPLTTLELAILQGLPARINGQWLKLAGRKVARAPFPWFGGKSRVAPPGVGSFGDVRNYVEPFAGSLAVLLARPTAAKIETVNDLDCYSEFLARGDQATRSGRAPCGLAGERSRPSRAAPCGWSAQAEFRERMKTDPDFFDPKIAGWWVWGISQWIGSGWCSAPEWGGKVAEKLPKIGGTRGGSGVHSRMRNLAATRNVGEAPRARPRRSRSQAEGVSEAAPGDQREPRRAAEGRSTRAGRRRDDPGVDGGSLRAAASRPRRAAATGRACSGRARPRRSASPGSSSIHRTAPTRTVDPSIYTHDSLTIATKVREWALEHGGDRRLRIALCGYEGEHEMPGLAVRGVEGRGGYAASAGNHENARASGSGSHRTASS
jgi:DNA adenine methylase